MVFLLMEHYLAAPFLFLVAMVIAAITMFIHAHTDAARIQQGLIAAQMEQFIIQQLQKPELMSIQLGLLPV